MDSIHDAIHNSGFCEVDVSGVATEINAGDLGKETVTLKFHTFREAGYLIEGLTSGTLRIRIVPGESYK